ncbi:MAG: ISL3 family transposase [Spirochaetota bacterium]
MEQVVDKDIKTVNIKVNPDERYTPVCHVCKTGTKNIHSYNERTIRDRDIFDAKTFISVIYRTLRCMVCGNVVEELPLMYPYERVTKRLATYIVELCQYMTITEVADHLGLDWKTVKDIHKRHLQQKFSQEDTITPRIILIDEISLKKRHTYLSVIADWDSGRVLGVQKDRTYESIKAFFDSLSDEVRAGIEAVGINMWDPYIKAITESCPKAMIVFDAFHVIAAFGRVIDKVRNSEYHEAENSGKAVIKGTKYLLLKNKHNITPEEKPRLKQLLELNQNLATAYILKDSLKKLWDYKYPTWAKKALDNWCSIAYESKVKPLMDFANTLMKYSYGIINHCTFPIHTSLLEGMNNKIKVIKRKAYGFHDIEYFSLVIKDAFT